MSESSAWPVIAITSGEPAGIGPDICARIALEPFAARLAVLGDPDLLADRARAAACDIDIDLLDDLSQAGRHRSGRLQVLPVPLATPAIAGRLNPANSAAVVEMLDMATRACLAGDADALVTAPVQKSTINEAGIPFSGHTERIGELTGAARAVMMLASRRLRVALATTHLPLADVSAAITTQLLDETLRILDGDLRHRFGIQAPRILVLGLNPHAGEGGVLGTEERDVIGPVVEALAATGLRLIGPVSADSAFTEASLSRCDAVLAMYHDQGLPVLKAQDFGEIVNVTLGLPIVRTSVDHGTALDLAGSGHARHQSLVAAIKLAIELADRCRS